MAGGIKMELCNKEEHKKYGEHYHVKCPNCGEELPTFLRRNSIAQVYRLHCPNCNKIFEVRAKDGVIISKGGR